MPQLQEVVDVQIDRQTTALTAPGFGKPLFLGLHKAFTERYREYTSLSAVGEDFATSSKEYIAASKFFGQEISVERIAIGRQDSSTVTFTPTVANNTAYTVVINGTTFTYTSDASALATEIVAGLLALINADVPLPVTASGTNTLILTGDAGVDFSVKATTNLVPVYAASETLTDALAAIVLENNTWYGLAAYTHVKADILEIAAWAEGAKKLYGTSSADADIYSAVGTDTTSVAAQLKALGYDRTFGIYLPTADSEYIECGLLGAELARDPGAATWAYKKVSGATVSSLTDTQDSNIRAKNWSTYTTIAGANVVFEGKVASGEFCDLRKVA